LSGRGSHYFADRPSTPSQQRPVRIELEDVELELTSDTGVFSAGRLDPGTRVLLEHAPNPPAGEVLDLGCGYGPIAVTLARREPGARIWAVDVNERALSLTAGNAEKAGAERVLARKPEDVPEDVRFDALYSNPPIRSGKAELHAMLQQWLPRLTEQGVAHLVVAKNLGADSLAKWLTGSGFPTGKLRSNRGYRLLEVTKG
jgi:16S rRNA G1207 methylase RsmC